MILQIAWRNIWRNKTRSVVIMLSVAIGILSAIAVMALYKGMLRSRVRTVIETETGHIQVHTYNFRKDYEPSFILNNGNLLLGKIRSLPEVRMAVARSITQGMLSTTTGSAGVQINGVEPATEYRFSQLAKKIVEGNGFKEGKNNQILIGKKLANKMKLKLGNKLVLTFTDTSGNIVAGAFRVAGIYQSDNAPLDERNVYLLMTDLNNLLGIGAAFHEIAVLLNNDDDVKQVQDRILKELPGFEVESWQQISPETELMVNTIDEYSLIILSVILFALAFGIINTMLMAILERTREVGMMMALGMNRMRLFAMILLETFFLTVTGAPVGLLIGWGIIAWYNKKGLDLSPLGEDMLSSFGYSRIVYPVFPVEQLAGVLLLVTAAAFLSSLFPAIKAIRLQPVKALQR